MVLGVHAKQDNIKLVYITLPAYVDVANPSFSLLPVKSPHVLSASKICDTVYRKTGHISIYTFR